MTGLLLKLFVKNYKDTAKSDVRENVGKMSSIVGIVLNVLLASAKVIVGALFYLVMNGVVTRCFTVAEKKFSYYR